MSKLEFHVDHYGTNFLVECDRTKYKQDGISGLAVFIYVPHGLISDAVEVTGQVAPSLMAAITKQLRVEL